MNTPELRSRDELPPGKDPDARLTKTPAPFHGAHCQVDHLLVGEQMFDCRAINVRVVSRNLSGFEVNAML
jgi:hypothetical protein